MREVTTRRVKSFQRKVFNHYEKNKRDLPWRTTTDPYFILLSEIMLQQTQVDRVISYYEKWISLWPTMTALAGAKRSRVLKEWSGLGYNRRGVNLHRAANIILDRYQGNVLRAMEHYQEIPGIGPYTSAAVRIFAGNQDIVTVDTNIRRILIHEFSLKESIPEKELWNIAQMCLPQGRSRDWHNALMDYGSLTLTSRKSGIPPKSRQSRFSGSVREMRGTLLKKFLSFDRALGAPELRGLGKGELIEEALKGLIKDGLVEKKNGKYLIREP